MKRTGTVNPAVLKDIVRRVARPRRIVMFGSAARGEMGPNSDVDLLVIKSGRYNRDRVTESIYHALFGADAAVDIVLVTPVIVHTAV